MAGDGGDVGESLTMTGARDGIWRGRRRSKRHVDVRSESDAAPLLVLGQEALSRKADAFGRR